MCLVHLLKMRPMRENRPRMKEKTSIEDACDADTLTTMKEKTEYSINESE